MLMERIKKSYDMIEITYNLRSSSHNSKRVKITFIVQFMVILSKIDELHFNLFQKNISMRAILTQ